MKDFIIICKQASEKENRKFIRKSLFQFLVLMVGFYLMAITFVNILFWIWRG